MLPEPAHRAAQPLEAAVGDAGLELGEEGVEADNLPRQRWPFAVERPEHGLGVEGVEPRLHVDEDGVEAEEALVEEGPAAEAVHDEEGAADEARVGARPSDAGRGEGEAGDGVLDGALAERPHGVVVRPEASEGRAAPSSRGVRRPGGRRRSGCRSPR